MRRTGEVILAAFALWAAAPAALAQDVEFYQAVDRKELGLEDTLRLTIVTANAPEDARVKLPPLDDFEILSRNNSTEMSFQMSGGGPGVVKRINKWVLVLRPLRVGAVTVPGASLVLPDGKRLQADPVQVSVKRGTVGLRPPPDPAQPAPLVPEEDEAITGEPIRIPRTDSDLFMRLSVDATSVFVGEQVTLDLSIYSRLDVSSVDPVKMPKLEGFWTEDVDSPNQLAHQQKLISGVPYRVYLLRRLALFPVKAGHLHIDPAETSVVTGFLFANQRVHRRTNALDIEVKPLPPGRPPGFSMGNVGQWRLSASATDTTVEVGQPLTVKVTLEGRGNLKNVAMPKLEAPAGLRVYDPTTTDRVSVSHGKLGGQRTQDYLVMPQGTGTFTLPALAIAYFDPVLERYEVSQTDPITLTVRPGGGAAVATQGETPAPPGGKNVLAEAGGLKPLRYQASFRPPAEALWRRAFFAPLVLAPPALWLVVLVGGVLRNRLSRSDPEAERRRRARAARARLAAAEKLRQQGQPAEFYGEVEKAVLRFLEAKLDVPVAGLTREALDQRLREREVPEDRRRRILDVLDACDAGRFAPGAGVAVRAQVLDDAAYAMEGWR